jgi:DNA polymerase I-like protein with 3'-5' exonuclease and polymerase domains
MTPTVTKGWAPREYEAKFLQPLTQVTCAMERRGVPFDVSGATSLLERIRDDEATTRRKLADWSGEGGIDYVGPEMPPNWGSWQQLQYFLYTPLGLDMGPSPYWKKGSTGFDLDGDEIYAGEGEYKTDDVALNWLASEYPEHAAGLGLIRTLRWQQRAANYVDTWLNLALPREGWHYLHPSFGLASDFDDRPGARTGRFAVKNPALQQVPVHQDEYGLRKLFKAPPGFVWVVCDFSVLEIVILAHLCHRLFGSDGLIKRVAPGAPDMHSVTAKHTFGTVLGDKRIQDLSLDVFKKEAEHERFLAKSVRYGLHYMKGARGFGDTLFDVNGKALGKAKAQAMIDGVLDIDPEIGWYHEWCRDTAPKWGCATSLLGRVSPLPDARLTTDKGKRNRAIRQFSNYGMQAGGQEKTGATMIELHRRNIEQVLQVHDEICSVVPERLGKEVMEETLHVMKTTMVLDAETSAAGGVADSWGGAK